MYNQIALFQNSDVGFLRIIACDRNTIPSTIFLLQQLRHFCDFTTL